MDGWQLAVLSVQEKQVVAEVKTGGVLTSNKGINLPGVLLDIPAFTEKDAEDLEFGLVTRRGFCGNLVCAPAPKMCCRSGRKLTASPRRSVRC